MSERWKYQIRTGSFWGIFMSVFMILFEIKEVPFIEQISKPSFYIRSVAYIAVGIFILGHINWKAKNKRLNNQ